MINYPPQVKESAIGFAKEGGSEGEGSGTDRFLGIMV